MQLFEIFPETTGKNIFHNDTVLMMKFIANSIEFWNINLLCKYVST